MAKFKQPNIKRANLAHLWWANKKGDKFIPTPNQIRQCFIPSPKQWPYAFSRFPTSVVTTCYKRRKKDGGYGSRDVVIKSESGASGELAVKLVVNSNYAMRLDAALVIASTACERCANILAYRNGLNWGYSHKSDDAKKCGTSCELCR